MAAQERLVRYRCTKVGSKLRVRVISPGYNPQANCQFPRAIREDGREYTTPVSSLKFAESAQHKFFYRVTPPKSITVVTQPLLDIKLYDKEELCCICICVPPEVVFYRCGHFACCEECATSLKKRECPLCRTTIERIVKEDELQT